MVTKPLNPQRLTENPDHPDITFDVPVLQETEPAPPPEGVTAARSGPAWRIMFQLTAPASRQVGLDIWRVTVLGRADQMSAFRPDLDFGPSGAMRFGVSRRHALVRPGEQSLYLIDQNSTNGTWVNGQRLLPGRDFALSDGDVIELGALRMTLRIVEAPPGSTGVKKSETRRMKGFKFKFFG